MIGDEDTRRLLEARHDVKAVLNPAVIAKTEAQAAIVNESRESLETGRQGLRLALDALDKDKTETDDEYAEFNTTKKKIIKRYGFSRYKVSEALLNTDPDDPISDEELNRRSKTFARYFSLNKTDFAALAHDDLIETLKPIIEAVATDKDIRPLNLAEAMSRDARALFSASDELSRERKEDKKAMEKVQEARAALDLELSAHALLIASLASRSGRKGELGQFIKSEEPAYKARRRAGLSIKEEPEAASIGTELSATSSPTEAVPE